MKNTPDGIVYYCESATSLLTSRLPKIERSLARRMLAYAFLDFFHMEFDEAFLRCQERGKPYYAGHPDIQFNISHCEGGAAVAVAHVPVGVDVEQMRKVWSRLAAKSCSSEELSYVLGRAGGLQKEDAKVGRILPKEETKRFLQLWTLKESYVKMTGEGLKTPLNKVNFRIMDDPDIKSGQAMPVLCNDTKNRHYLYRAKSLFLALSVWQEEGEKEKNFLWKEICSPFRSLDGNSF